MLSRDLLRDAAERVRDLVASRGYDPELVDRWTGLDAGRRAALVELEELKQRRNEASRAIGEIKREGGDAGPRSPRSGGSRAASAPSRRPWPAIDGELAEVELELPNLPHDSVPVGADESANRVERLVASRPRSTSSPRPTGTSAPSWASSTSSAAPSSTGARFTVYWGAGARLERALINFMLDLHTGEHGYTRGAAAVHRQRRLARRHRPAAQVRGRPVPGSTGDDLLPDPHRRGAADQPAPRRDPRRGGPAARATPPTRPASAARPAPTARTCAA